MKMKPVKSVKVGPKAKPRLTAEAKKRLKAEKKYFIVKKKPSLPLRRSNKGIVGRPSGYPAVSKRLVFNLYLLGLTDEKVAEILDISGPTLTEWKQKYPEFKATIKQAKDEADSRVVRSLYERGIGTKVKAVKFFKTNDDRIVQKEYIEHYPPDVTAIMFWLRNRQPELFRDRKEHEMSIHNTVSYIIEKPEHQKLLEETRKELEELDKQP